MITTSFNPDAVTAKSGIFKSFHRNGEKIDNSVLIAGIMYYNEQEKKSLCEKCVTPIAYKAWLVSEDLKRAGWVFSETVFFDNPVDLICLSIIGCSLVL
jgi:hypothetical protein